MTFKHTQSYTIDTLPDDLSDAAVAVSDKWAIRDALFWNDCQGWWVEHIADYWLGARFSQHMARFWRPMPPAPMTREAILSERGMAICGGCGVAVQPSMPHECRA